MKKYFPFLRGKQNELMAIRDLAEQIAEHGNIVPIIEPVKNNSNTRISLDRYVEVSMPFLFICNPTKGVFVGQHDALFDGLVTESLLEYDNWTPTLQVQHESHASEISQFLDRYQDFETGVFYRGLPANAAAQGLLANESIVHHIFFDNHVEANYIDGVAASQRVMMSDLFHRQERNADYPEHEFFTDKNTVSGNPQRLDFGDFSIVGDHYADGGGPAYAVTLHHIHFQNGAGPLDISHFISDNTETPTDTPGKIIEAVSKLVDALEHLHPNSTSACDEYREMAQTQIQSGLGYMKRLAIRHHLEVMLNGGIQL